MLYLLRHAKSSWDDPALRDHDRPLAPRGERAAQLIAGHLRTTAVDPDLILCSTAVRTRQTLAGIAPAFDSPPAVLFERALYGASADALLRRLHALSDDVHTVMLIGHSSGIEDLALLLAGSGDGLARVREKFPTGALATLHFEGSWRRLRPRDATLSGFVAPRSLDEG